MAQHCSKTDKCRIAGGMSMPVIELLETVEIEQRERQGRVVAAGNRREKLQMLVEGLVIRDAGKSISAGFTQRRFQCAGLNVKAPTVPTPRSEPSQTKPQRQPQKRQA